jgi:hypothetical protein
MNCCEYHGVSCDQGRTCPLRNRDEQADYPPTTPEEAESWVLPTLCLSLFFRFRWLLRRRIPRRSSELPVQLKGQNHEYR